jgi:hypothetical protein
MFFGDPLLDNLVDRTGTSAYDMTAELKTHMVVCLLGSSPKVYVESNI